MINCYHINLTTILDLIFIVMLILSIFVRGLDFFRGLDFGLSKQYHPTFFRPHLKICAGPKQTFQYNPMTVPGAIRMMQKPSEIRPLLQFVATQVFQS